MFSKIAQVDDLSSISLTELPNGCFAVAGIVHPEGENGIATTTIYRAKALVRLCQLFKEFEERK